jgi:hypothetical protein
MRRPLRYAAWVAFDNEQTHGCTLSDVSDSGARLEVEDSSAVPDHFLLWLSGNGAARRKCRVVWRTPRQIGVAFEKRAVEAETAMPAHDNRAFEPELTAAAAAPAFDIETLSKAKD